MKNEIWKLLARPPKTALKQISGGRLKGMTDINPQWRYEIMTEVFGMVGVGWKFTIDKTWFEQASDNQVFAFAQVSVFVKNGDNWSDAIQGQGGSMLIEQEKNGPHSCDEGYKMAITDALGTALKMLGVASDIYAGRWDGSKYKDVSGGAISPTKLAYEALNEEDRIKAKEYADEIEDKFKISVEDAYIYADSLPREDENLYIGAWHLVSSSTRSALKKFKDNQKGI